MQLLGKDLKKFLMLNTLLIFLIGLMTNGRRDQDKANIASTYFCNVKWGISREGNYILPSERWTHPNELKSFYGEKGEAKLDAVHLRDVK